MTESSWKNTKLGITGTEYEAGTTSARYLFAVARNAVQA